MPWFKIVVGLLIALVVLRVGIWFLRGLANPLPPPPPPGQMRRVNLRYRCSVCGLEIKMTSAPNEEPEPPRHCLQEMEQVAALE